MVDLGKDFSAARQAATSVFSTLPGWIHFLKTKPGYLKTKTMVLKTKPAFLKTKPAFLKTKSCYLKTKTKVPAGRCSVEVLISK